MHFRLAIEQHDQTRRVVVSQREVEIGSGDGCAVQIPHPTVSRRHAILRRRGKDLEIEDLGSRNGTTVGGVRISQPKPLAPGDRLAFGAVSVVVEAVTGAELETAIELDAPRDTPDRAGSETTTGVADTEVDSPAETWVRDHLGFVLERLADGRSQVDVAQAVGAALAASLRATRVEIGIDDGEVRGLLFRQDAGGAGARLERSVGPVMGEICLPSVSPRNASAIVEASLRIVDLAARNAPGTREPDPAAEPPAPPDPPSVEPVVQKLYSDAVRVAPGDVSILVRGESGTGKEVFARFIHAASDRAAGPLEALNCAALPRDLLEAELFGIEQGVATGVGARPGRFEVAHGGTLFLDEIGDMAPETQATILRVLQERQVYRLGGRAPRPADVRIVAATNRDLDRMLTDGRFRGDLFHRIADWDVRLPALRERPGDIPQLAAWFLARDAGRRGIRVRGISRAALEALVEAPWPGNIRQLEREIATAVLFLEDDEVLETRHLSSEIRGDGPVARPGSLQSALEATERREIRRALAEAEGSVPDAAASLDVGRSTLYRRMKELGIGE